MRAFLTFTGYLQFEAVFFRQGGVRRVSNRRRLTGTQSTAADLRVLHILRTNSQLEPSFAAEPTTPAQRRLQTTEGALHKTLGNTFWL